MARIDTTPKAGGNGSSGGDFVLLPTDIYRMKVIKSTYGDNPFADPNKDGTKPKQITLTWEVTQLNEDQLEAMTEAEEDWDSATVPQYISPFYGDVKAGGPSRFKALVDSLVEQGYLKEFDPADFDPDTLIGVEQKVNVLKYIKGQGENAGKPGNKVIDVLPLRAAKRTRPNQEKPGQVSRTARIPVPAGADEDDEGDLPF